MTGRALVSRRLPAHSITGRLRRAEGARSLRAGGTSFAVSEWLAGCRLCGGQGRPTESAGELPGDLFPAGAGHGADLVEVLDHKAQSRPRLGADPRPGSGI